MADITLATWFDLGITGVFAVGAVLALYQMQIRMKKSNDLMPGVSSSFWLLGLAIFSLTLAQASSTMLVGFYGNTNFPSVSDLFEIVGYIAFLIFLLRLMFPGDANMWLATLAAAILLSFQALLLQYILTVRQEVSMSIILQFFYILLGFTFTVISLYVSRKYSNTAVWAVPLALGVFSIAQLSGNWFFSASVSSGGTALAQSREIGALLVRAASALSLGLGIPLAFTSMENAKLAWRSLLGQRQFQLAAGVMMLAIYLLVSSTYFMTIALPSGAAASRNLEMRETALRENLISAQGAFQIYLIFAILLGYSQTSLHTQEFQEQILNLNKTLDRTVAERTDQLKARLGELEKFKRITVGRELRMVELKDRLRDALQAPRGKRQ